MDQSLKNGEHGHDEHHFINRSNWLRAAVLGANDGIVSISSLLIAVAAAGSDSGAILIAGIAGLVAGAMSMAAGEYVSVSSQTDIERADVEREREALKQNPEEELRELVAIYRSRGLKLETAKLVAEELTASDPLEAHLRDELGLSEVAAANPYQAAFTSFLAFTLAGALPLLAAVLSPEKTTLGMILLVTVLALALLGWLGAKAGGAHPRRAVARVLFWGVLAMGVSAGIGHLFGFAL